MDFIASSLARCLRFLVRWIGQRRALSRLALVGCGLLAGLLLVELIVWLTESDGSPIARTSAVGLSAEEKRGLSQPIADSRLLVRLPPLAPGHDAKGFRNDTVPDLVDIVAIGDSQTYGLNAPSSEAWPQDLATRSGLTVYNMGLGFYGPVQYWVLTEEALELSPKIVVVGLYLGNDLWGAYSGVYQWETHAGFRSDTVSGELLEDTIGPRAQALADEAAAFVSAPPSWSDWLVRRSATVRALFRRGWWPRVTSEEGFEAAKAWALAHPDHGAVYEDGTVRTVLTTAYRLLALDLDEPRVAEGLRITKAMLLGMKERTEGAGVQLLVLFIPTKETVHAEAMQKIRGRLDDTYARLVQMEAQAKGELTSLLREHGIEYVDVLSPRMEAVRRGELIFPDGIGGHFLGRGYALMAVSVHETLERLGWLP